MRKADVIIPTFKPGDKLEKLLRRLLEQSVPVGRVIIMNTEEKYWDAERFESLFEGEDTKLTVCISASRNLTMEGRAMREF